MNQETASLSLNDAARNLAKTKSLTLAFTASSAVALLLGLVRVSSPRFL